MKVLAADTSSSSGSVALVEGARVIAEVSCPEVSGHAVWLMPSIEGLLKDSSAAITDIDLFAVTNGPGSFTGLRIGVSVVKGLAWAVDRKVAGVSTLYALAMNMRGTDTLICPLLDARKKEVYAGLYRFSAGRLDTVMEAAALTPDELFRAIGERAEPVAFTGSGLKPYAQAVRMNVKDAFIAPPELWDIKASNVAAAALEKAHAPVSPRELALVYLRKSEVELKGGSAV